MRRYGLSRTQLTGMLHRIAGEGWIERLPGHGWEFLPMLTSLQSYQDSYRFVWSSSRQLSLSQISF